MTLTLTFPGHSMVAYGQTGLLIPLGQREASHQEQILLKIILLQTHKVVVGGEVLTIKGRQT